jgi:hypothetical protein
MTAPSGLIILAHPNEFFQVELSEAQDKLGVRLSETLECYLVHLLSEYCSASTELPEPGGEPLALLYKQALEASPFDRIQILQPIGDVAL